MVITEILLTIVMIIFLGTALLSVKNNKAVTLLPLMFFVYLILMTIDLAVNQ